MNGRSSQTPIKKSITLEDTKKNRESELLSIRKKKIYEAQSKKRNLNEINNNDENRILFLFFYN